jgi:transposase
MLISQFHRLIKTESKAKRYLVNSCWKNHQKFCIHCKTRRIYRIPEYRYRCKRCGYKFSDFTGRWIAGLKTSPLKWLWIIKLFELELSTRRIAKEVGVSYPTALRATTIIRRAILANKGEEKLLKGEIEADETYFGGRRKGPRGRGAKNKVPVFGILERNGIVQVQVIPDISADTVLDMTIKKVRRGSIVYTDKFRIYDSLMFCGYRHLKIDHGKCFTRGKVYINGLEGFWSYAKERLIKFHGVSKEKFPLYLKELLRNF